MKTWIHLQSEQLAQCSNGSQLLYHQTVCYSDYHLNNRQYLSATVGIRNPFFSKTIWNLDKNVWILNSLVFKWLGLKLQPKLKPNHLKIWHLKSPDFKSPLYSHRGLNIEWFQVPGLIFTRQDECYLYFLDAFPYLKPLCGPFKYQIFWTINKCFLGFLLCLFIKRNLFPEIQLFSFLL